MANLQTALCPDCGVEMRPRNVFITTLGPMDSEPMDPAFEQWVSVTCPKCLVQFQVNSKTGVVVKLR